MFCKHQNENLFEKINKFLQKKNNTLVSIFKIKLRKNYEHKFLYLYFFNDLIFVYLL